VEIIPGWKYKKMAELTASTGEKRKLKFTRD